MCISDTGLAVIQSYQQHQLKKNKEEKKKTLQAKHDHVVRD